MLNYIYRNKRNHKKSEKKKPVATFSGEVEFVRMYDRRTGKTLDTTKNGSGGKKRFIFSDRKHDLYPTKKVAPPPTRVPPPTMNPDWPTASPYAKRIKITTNDKDVNSGSGAHYGNSKHTKNGGNTSKKE